jgi:hypothetical protein
MEGGSDPSGPEVSSGPGPVPSGGATLWWHVKQAPPICPTCRTFCRCRRTMLKEDARIQYRYCETCAYKTKTIVPVK